MEPALRPGDWLLVLRTRRAKPGRIVIARHPGKPDMLLVKRAAYRTAGGWWLSSDNPAAGAVDSRRFGPVPAVEGKVLFRYRRSLSHNGCGPTNRPRPVFTRRDRSGRCGPIRPRAVWDRFP
jgi:nickel-type superoxide dismutase maturation protease